MDTMALIKNKFVPILGKSGKLGPSFLGAQFGVSSKNWAKANLPS